MKFQRSINRASPVLFYIFIIIDMNAHLDLV